MANETVTITVVVNDKASKGLGSLGGAAKSSGKELSLLGSLLPTAGMFALSAAALQAGAALARMAAGGVAAAIRANAELEQSIQNAVALSGGAYEELEKAAVDAGMSAAFSAREAGDALAFLAQAGFSATQASSALPGVLNLASAGSLELASAADIASNVLSGFKLQVEDLSRVNDVLAATSSSANTNVEQLGVAFRQVAPLAQASNQSLESVSAALGVLGNAGIQGSQAGTVLRASLAALQKPSGEAAKIIADLGVQTLDTQGKMRPLVDILDDISKAGASSADFTTIFGREAISGVLALTGATEQLRNETTRLNTEAEGTADRIAQQKLDTVAGQYQILTGSIDTYAARIGSTFNPALKESLEATNAVLASNVLFKEELERLSKVLGENKDVIADLALSGLVALSTAVASAADILERLGDGFEFVSSVADRFGRFIGITDQVTASFTAKAAIAAGGVRLLGMAFFGLVTFINPIVGLLGQAALGMTNLEENAADAAMAIGMVDEERRLKRIQQDTESATVTFGRFVDKLKEYPLNVAKGVAETVKARVEEERLAKLRGDSARAVARFELEAARAKTDSGKIEAEQRAAIARIIGQGLASDLEGLKIARVRAQFADRLQKARLKEAKSAKQAADLAEQQRKAETDAAAKLSARNALAEYKLDVLTAQTEQDEIQAQFALELEKIETQQLTTLEAQVAVKEAEVKRDEALLALSKKQGEERRRANAKQAEADRRAQQDRQRALQAEQELIDLRLSAADALASASTGVDGVGGVGDAIRQESALIEGELSRQLEALEGATNEQKDAVRAAAQARIDALDNELVKLDELRMAYEGVSASVSSLANAYDGVLSAVLASDEAQTANSEATTAALFGDKDATEKLIVAKKSLLAAEQSRTAAISATGKAASQAAGILGANAQAEAAILAVFEAAAAASAIASLAVTGNPAFAFAAAQHGISAALNAQVAGTSVPTASGGGASAPGGAGGATTPGGFQGTDPREIFQLQAEAIANALGGGGEAGGVTIIVDQRESINGTMTPEMERRITRGVVRGLEASNYNPELIRR